VSIRLAGLRTGAGDLAGVIAERPRHLMLFSLVAGLLTGAWASGLAAWAAVLAGLLPSRPRVAACAVLAVGGGAALADARLEAIGSGAPPAPAGAWVSIDVVPVEPVRTRASGERVVRASPRREGGDVLLKARPGVVLPGDIGAVVRVRGTVAPLDDFDVFQRRRGAVAAVEVVSAVTTGTRRGGLSGLLDGARRRATTALSGGLPRHEGALLRGMVLGQDDAIAQDVRRRYEDSSLAHLLAVSGTNVMLLAALVIGACALVGVPLELRLTLALVCVAAYVPLTGAGASIQRAGVMGAAGLVALMAGRPSDRWYALGLAAALTLALNPYAAADAGWQLSFAAVIGLALLAPRLRDALTERRLPRALAEASAMTIAATIATAPLLAAHFGRASLVALPANLLATPVVAPLMWLGMLAATVGQIAPSLAVPLNFVNARLVAYVDWVATVTAGLPHSAVDVPEPGMAAVVAVYAAMFAVVLGGPPVWRIARASAGPFWSGTVRRRPAVSGIALLAVALLTGTVALRLTTAAVPPGLGPGETRVAFLDVGQGDATLVRAGGSSVLFDTGPPGSPVCERLAGEGVRRLDVLVITHAQADHEGAALEVVRRMRPRVVVDGGAGWPTRVQSRLAHEAASVGARVVVPWSGRSLRVGALDLRFLWPTRALMASPPDGDPNLRALVTHVRHGAFDLLLPADAESDVTAGLRLPRVEALKVAHHGSVDDGLPGFLRRVAPAVAAIQVGRGNSYGHPAPSTLAALHAAVSSVHRTDRDGTIRLRAIGERMTVERAGPRR